MYNSILNIGAALPIWKILKDPSVPEPAEERRDGSAKAFQHSRKSAAFDIRVCLHYRNGPILTETTGVSSLFPFQREEVEQGRET